MLTWKKNVIPPYFLCQNKQFSLYSCANCLKSSSLEHKVVNVPFAFLCSFNIRNRTLMLSHISHTHHLRYRIHLSIQESMRVLAGVLLEVSTPKSARFHPHPVHSTLSFLVKPTIPHPVNLECICIDLLGPFMQVH